MVLKISSLKGLPDMGKTKQQKPIPPSQGFLHSPVFLFSSKEIFYSFTGKLILE